MDILTYRGSYSYEAKGPIKLHIIKHKHKKSKLRKAANGELTIAVFQNDQIDDIPESQLTQVTFSKDEVNQLREYFKNEETTGPSRE